MTSKQYAFICKAKQFIKDVRTIAILGQEGDYDTEYHALCRIEDKCDDFLRDFEDTEP